MKIQLTNLLRKVLSGLFMFVWVSLLFLAIYLVIVLPATFGIGWLVDRLDLNPLVMILWVYLWAFFAIKVILPAIVGAMTQVNIPAKLQKETKPTIETNLSEEERKVLEPFLAKAIRPLSRFDRSYKPDPKVPFRKALMRYLFVKKFEVPPFFENALQWHLSWETIERFLFVVEGGDLKDLPGLPIPMTRRMLSMLGKITQVADFKSAVYMAEILGLGGDDQLFWAIQGADHLSYIRKPENHAFWRDVWVFLIHQPKEEQGNVRELVAYIQAQKFGHPRYDSEFGNFYLMKPLQPGFCIKGRNLQKLKEEAKSWYRKTFSMDACTLPAWAEEIQPLSVIFGKLHYEINPLRTKEEVIMEGDLMRHCVGDYAEDCIMGETSIWSMTACEPGGIPEKIITIEVEHGKYLCEALGFENRHPTEEETSVILRWARENELSNHLNP